MPISVLRFILHLFCGIGKRLWNGQTEPVWGPEAVHWYSDSGAVEIYDFIHSTYAKISCKTSTILRCEVEQLKLTVR